MRRFPPYIERHGPAIGIATILLVVFVALSASPPFASTASASRASMISTYTTAYSVADVTTTSSPTSTKTVTATSTDDGKRSEADSGNTRTETTTVQNVCDPDGPCIVNTGTTKMTCYDLQQQLLLGLEVNSGWLEVLCGSATASAGLEVFGMKVFPAAAQPATPAPPPGLRELTGLELQLQPIITPNDVTLTLYYTDAQLGSSQESALRIFYRDDTLDTWVELPVTVDAAANSVTVQGLDVSAFADNPHRVGVFGT
jgi:hypothetical protein